MNVIATVEARMTSTRLPGKILRPILGKPMLELLVERLKRARRLDGIAIATTVHRTDDPVEELAVRLGVACFRGSEEDVLDRVLQAARSTAADVIVEITGDCPLIDPGVVDRLVEIHARGGFDYVANVLERTYPLGLDTQVFTTDILQQVAEATRDPVDREHVSLYIYTHPERFRLHNVRSDLDQRHWNLRLTVDTAEDLALITAIFESLYPTNPAFDLHDVLRFLDSRPDLLSLNQHVVQKRAR